MKQTTRHLVLWLIYAAFFVTCMVTTYHLAYGQFPPYDAAYNFLTYKSLVDFGRFEHPYGHMPVPFNPIVSTGPTVNGIIALFYWLSLDENGFYLGTAAVNVFGWALLLLSMCALGGLTYGLLGGLCLVGLVYATPNLITETVLFSGLGEYFSVVWVWVGFLLLGNRWSLSRVFLGALCIGFGLLTKLNIAVGLVLPAAYGMVCLYMRRRELVVKTAVQSIGVLFLGVVGPTWVFKKALPNIVLTAEQYQVFDQSKRDYQDSIRGFAFQNLYTFKQYLQDKNPTKLQLIWNNLAAKVDALVGATHGVLGLVLVSLGVLLALGLASTPYYRKKNHSLLCMGAFSVGVFGWWFFLNDASWYRYLSPAVISMIILTSALLAVEASRIWKNWQGPLVAIKTNGLGVALCITIMVSSFYRLPSMGTYVSFFNERERLKATLSRMVAASKPIGDGIFFGWGWFQSPELRCLTNLKFLNVEDPEDVVLAQQSDRRLFMATGPTNFSVERFPQWLKDTTKGTVFEEDTWRIYEIDRTKLKSPL